MAEDRYRDTGQPRLASVEAYVEENPVKTPAARPPALRETAQNFGKT
jgi:hypothetical protein